jgi:hypothetical protein
VAAVAVGQRGEDVVGRARLAALQQLAGLFERDDGGRAGVRAGGVDQRGQREPLLPRAHGHLGGAGLGRGGRAALTSWPERQAEGERDSDGEAAEEHGCEG